ncbi:FkbM family methyltransferase [Flavobacterium hiemivividum]|uniref:FkbM family methyltransferase n=1 Tax=Flavobacterium hiemivividum TaxID=2541734 RepID=A0A4R5CYG0_9FLAO|nr:FkbM family methyltransferase [Flavobacterium hiemivividum]TDE04570.1 FkbM family methyltransferase [Flavobacterium hiemivividum]
MEISNQYNLILRDYNFSDYEVLEQIFNFREYDVVLKMMLLNFEHLKSPVIIDAGANVGYTSLFFSNYFKDLRIFAIEPSFSNVEIYRQNINFFKNNTATKLYHRALSHKSSLTFTVERNFRDRKDWSITTKEDVKGEVKGITIDDILKENSLEYISLLKIDVEGAERFLFTNNNDLSFLKNTKIVAIEIHDEYNCRIEIENILRRKGFFLFESGELTIGINKILFND